MSTHVYDNLKVNKNFTMNTGGTISSTAVDLQLVPDTDRMLAFGLNGLSNHKTVAGSISKTIFVTSTLTTSVQGNNTLPLFEIAVGGSTVGGFKTFISLTDGQVSERFDEFFGSLQGNTTFTPQVYQLSSLCVGSLSLGFNASSLTVSAISGGVCPFSYTFPYTAANHTVQVSCCIEWYGTADASFGKPGSSPTLGSNSGISLPSSSNAAGVSPPVTSSAIQSGSDATLQSLEVTNSIHIDTVPDGNTVSLRLEGTSQNNNGTALSIGGAGAISVDFPGISGGRLMLNDQGQMGIQQNNPQYTLDVTGNINASGYLLQNGRALTAPSFGNYAILHDSTYPDGAISAAQFDSNQCTQISTLSLDFASGKFSVASAGMYTLTWSRWVTNQSPSSYSSVHQTWNLTTTDTSFNNSTSTSNDYVGRDSQSRYFMSGDTFTVNLHPTGNLQLYGPTALRILFIPD